MALTPRPSCQRASSPVPGLPISSTVQSMSVSSRLQIAFVSLCFLALGPSVRVYGGQRTTASHTVGFASAKKLSEHFQKHGKEFNARSEGDYLRSAQELRDRKLTPPLLEGIRKDKVITRFDPKSVAFLAFESNKVIRTFFRPDDGERYFWRQLKR